MHTYMFCLHGNPSVLESCVLPVYSWHVFKCNFFCSDAGKRRPLVAAGSRKVQCEMALGIVTKNRLRLQKKRLKETDYWQEMGRNSPLKCENTWFPSSLKLPLKVYL